MYFEANHKHKHSTILYLDKDEGDLEWLRAQIKHKHTTIQGYSKWDLQCLRLTLFEKSILNYIQR